LKTILFIFRFITHYFEAKNTKGYGVHSPSLYRFTQNVIYERIPFYAFPEIEKLRARLKSDQRLLHLTDYGTGKRNTAKVSEIAKSSLKKPVWAQLLYRTINFTKAKTVVELGTSLGITTAYLALSDKDIRCTTFEGSAEVAAIARENFDKLDIKNIEIIVGNLDETLTNFLEQTGILDVVFFDANHRKEPVLKYFEQCVKHIQRYSVFIVDDIHWSREMEDAWFEIQNHQDVRSTIDLFECGIVFFDKYLPKKHYKMNILL